MYNVHGGKKYSCVRKVKNCLFDSVSFEDVAQHNSTIRQNLLKYEMKSFEIQANCNF